MESVPAPADGAAPPAFPFADQDQPLLDFNGMAYGRPARQVRITSVGKLLERAIAEMQRLPESDQEAIAAWLLAEIESEEKWDELFAKPSLVIERMADEAIREHEAGLTEPLSILREKLIYQL